MSVKSFDCNTNLLFIASQSSYLDAYIVGLYVHRFSCKIKEQCWPRNCRTMYLVQLEAKVMPVNMINNFTFY